MTTDDKKIYDKMGLFTVEASHFYNYHFQNHFVTLLVVVVFLGSSACSAIAAWSLDSFWVAAEV